VTGESEVEVLLEGDGVAEGVSIVPDSLLGASDDVSEGYTEVPVLELIDSVYEGISELLDDSLDDADNVVQYE
jgi:hypothetical protein